MTVVSNGVDDAVRSAGGWLCDRVRAGWHVTVVLPEGHDPRPLQILGIRAWTTEDFVGVIKATTPVALGISSGAVGDDVRILKLIDRARDRSLLEVTIWGDEVPLAAEGRVGAVEYRMSSAARAFKTVAIAAAGSAVSESVPVIRDPFVEVFHGHAPYLPHGADSATCD
jgi:hypothetical protein